MLNEVKHLANVSFQVPARDSSDATLCQNDTQREGKAFMDNCYIVSIRQSTPKLQLLQLRIIVVAAVVFLSL